MSLAHSSISLYAESNVVRFFLDDADRNNFIGRVGGIVTDTTCYAWALISNHFHLLLRIGNVPVATVMRRLLTGHAGYFNKRHRRSGHLRI